jgi:hypothetical protein
MIPNRWFELRTGNPANGGTHCLIRLSHPKAPSDPQERWDAAAQLATTVLGRSPTRDELRPLGSDAVGEFTHFDYNLIFIKGSVLGVKPPRNTGRPTFREMLKNTFSFASKHVPKPPVDALSIADDLTGLRRVTANG